MGAGKGGRERRTLAFACRDVHLQLGEKRFAISGQMEGRDAASVKSNKCYMQPFLLFTWCSYTSV